VSLQVRLALFAGDWWWDIPQKPLLVQIVGHPFLEHIFVEISNDRYKFQWNLAVAHPFSNRYKAFSPRAFDPFNANLALADIGCQSCGVSGSCPICLQDARALLLKEHCLDFTVRFSLFLGACSTRMIQKWPEKGANFRPSRFARARF